MNKIQKYLGLLFAALLVSMLPVRVQADTSTLTTRLVNVSSRAYVGSGANVLIAGFVITGSGQKKVLLRGVGPGLAKLGVPGALNAAKIELHTTDSNGKDVVLMTNIQWDANSTDAADVVAADGATGAFPLVAGSKDAARVVFLFPGNYTLILSAADGVNGVGLVEAYEIP